MFSRDVFKYVPTFLLIFIPCMMLFYLFIGSNDGILNAALESLQEANVRPDEPEVQKHRPEVQKHRPEVQHEPEVQQYRPVDLNMLQQDDPRLIKEIRRRFLVPPPPRDTPYSLNEPIEEDPSKGQSEVLRRIFKDKRDGFFVECGAADGEFFSNTLHLERRLGWGGLLVEADPRQVPLLLKKQRHAWIAPVCLSLSSMPSTVRFVPLPGGRSKILPFGAPRDPSESPAQCLPFYALLLALNRTRVDYFSLDVEGAEFAVLKTIPFHLLDIKTMSVEYRHVTEGADVLETFMKDKGYRVHTKLTTTGTADDFVFVKNDFLPEN